MTVTDPIARHIADLERALHGPARCRRDMLAEARDGLLDATAAYVDGGLEPRSAAEHAVREFGAIAEIAPLYQEELTVRQGRRAALLLATSFPGLMLGWDLIWSSGITHSGPALTAVALLARMVDVTSILIAVVALALLLATFGRRASPRPATAAIGLVGLLGTALTLGASVAMNVLGASSRAGSAMSAVEVAASAVSAVVGLFVLRSAVLSIRVALRR